MLRQLKKIITIKENRTNKSYVIKVKKNNIKEKIDGIIVMYLNLEIMYVTLDNSNRRKKYYFKIISVV